MLKNFILQHLRNVRAVHLLNFSLDVNFEWFNINADEYCCNACYMTSLNVAKKNIILIIVSPKDKYEVRCADE